MWANVVDRGQLRWIWEAEILNQMVKKNTDILSNSWPNFGMCRVISLRANNQIPVCGQAQLIGPWEFFMMPSSNGNIFRVTGPLCGEFTGPGEFPAQRPVTQSFDVFFDLRLNKRLSKQPWCWWFETPPWSLWRQCNVLLHFEISNCQANFNYWWLGYPSDEWKWLLLMISQH